MTLIINNDVVHDVLTMDATIAALETSYLALARAEGVCRPRIDIQIPTSDPAKIYRWGTMEGGAVGGYFAIRMKSDIMFENHYAGGVAHEKFCKEPGLFCGLILLFDTENGEPLAIINDGHLQHARVGADGGIGVRYMSRTDAEVVGMLGSGGMARSHMEAFMAVRPIKKLKVFSPTPANREAYAKEMAELHGIETEVCDAPEQVYRDADILAGCTDAAAQVIDGTLVEPGTHVVNVGAGGLPGRDLFDRVDVFLRFGDSPQPVGTEGFDKGDEFFTFAARPDDPDNFLITKGKKRRPDATTGKRRISFSDLAADNPGRTDDSEITYSERGNIQGAQFHAVAGVAYEAARQAGLGHEIPTDWLLQDIRN